MEPSSRSVQRTHGSEWITSSATILPLTLLRPLFLTISGSIMLAPSPRESVPQDFISNTVAELGFDARDGDSPAGTDGGFRSQNGPNKASGSAWERKVIHADSLGGLA